MEWLMKEERWRRGGVEYHRNVIAFLRFDKSWKMVVKSSELWELRLLRKIGYFAMKKEEGSLENGGNGRIWAWNNGVSFVCEKEMQKKVSWHFLWNFQLDRQGKEAWTENSLSHLLLSLISCLLHLNFEILLTRTTDEVSFHGIWEPLSIFNRR